MNISCKVVSASDVASRALATASFTQPRSCGSERAMLMCAEGPFHGQTTPQLVLFQSVRATPAFVIFNSAHKRESQHISRSDPGSGRGVLLGAREKS